MMTPFGGMLSYSMGGTAGPFQSGSTVTLMCTSGSVTGTSSATCTNGQWSPPTLGTCSTTGAGTGGIGNGQTCFPMFPPFGATLSYSSGGMSGPYQSGTTVTLMCTSGFPTGSSTATCFNGQWSPATLGTCSSTGTGGLPGTGSGLTCPAMMTPFGGTLSYSMGGTTGPFQSGTTVTLMCTSGFPT
ncbi:sushi domain protein, partial [Ostertagia ostertagi]